MMQIAQPSMTDTRNDTLRPTLESTTPAVCIPGVELEPAVSAHGGGRENIVTCKAKLLRYSYVAVLLMYVVIPHRRRRNQGGTGGMCPPQVFINCYINCSLLYV